MIRVMRRLVSCAGVAALIGVGGTGVAWAAPAHGSSGVTHAVRPHTSPTPPDVPKYPAAKPSKPATPAKPTSTKVSAPTDPKAAALTKARADAVAQAKKTGKPAAIPALTTDRATTQANPDGSFTVSETMKPQRAKVGDSWVPIDTTLAKAKDGTWHPKAAVDGITVSGGGTGPLAKVLHSGDEFAISWPLGALPAPRISGDTATYPQVLPGVDLRVTVGAEGIAEVLVVHDAQAAANPALAALKFNVSGTGVKLKTDAGGALVGLDKKGNTEFVGGTPQMWDSSTAPAPTSTPSKNAVDPKTAVSPVPEPDSQPKDPADGPAVGARSAAMPVSLSGGTATIVPDASILKGSGTKYPVYIDPSINAAQTDYAEIRQGQATSSFEDLPGDANGTFTRVGWDANSNGVGGTISAIRGMYSFDVYNTLQGINDSPSGQSQGNYVEEFSTNITSATFTLTAHAQQGTCSPMPVFDLYRTGPMTSPPTWAKDGPGSSGAFGTQAIFLGQRTPSACGSPGQVSIDDTDQVKSVYTNAFNNPAGARATLGIRQAAEDVNHPFWSFYVNDNNGSFGNATLSITYVAAPYITQVSTTPALTSRAGCGPLVQDGGLRANAGYLNKNIGNQITLGAQFSDFDGGRSIQTNYQFIDHSAADNYYLPGPGIDNYYANIGSAQGAAVPFPGATLTQSAGQLKEGHLYSFEPYAQDTFDSGYLNSSVAGSSQECYFTVAFNAPDAPKVAAPDFPQLGNPSAPGMYATMPDTTGFQITGTTSGVNIDHFDYVLNGDSSKVGVTSAGGGSVPAYVTGNALTGNGATATIPVPQGATTFGTNTLWVRAVDKAGNQSQFTQYDFYLPGNPNAVPVLGDVTGKGVPDVVAVQALDPTKPVSATNPEHLVTYPGDSDPNAGTASYSQVSEAAPATDAPDGVSWANTLVTHRGALRGIAVDDLFAYSTVTHAMYYYLNQDSFGGVMNADQFAISQKVLIGRPTCTPSPANNNCFGYASDWSNVKAIVALGNAAGNKIGTFAGRTNLLTVESNGNGGANLWMFSPGPGLGQLTNPVLISGDGSWLGEDLIPASDQATGLTDLWVRDQASGTLYQYQNKRDSAGVEDPTSLGNPADRTSFPGSYPVSSYGALSSAGNPVFSTDGKGVLSQTGPPALAALQPDGQLKILPGSAQGPVTSAHGDWDTTHTAWTATNGITEVNGSAVTDAAGIIRLGPNSTLCLDLSNGSNAVGTTIQSWNCNGTDAQDWSIYPDGTIRIVKDLSKCIQIGTSPGDQSATMTGDPIQLGSCPSADSPAAPAQHWVVRASDGNNAAFNLYNPNSGRCLDDTGISTSGGTAMQLYDCVDTAQSPDSAQQWYVPPSNAAHLVAEGEALAPYTHEQATQSTSIVSNGNYSGGQAYVLAGHAVGDHYGVDYIAPYEGDYAIWTSMVGATNYGITQLSVDSTVMPYTYDGYNTANNSYNVYWGKMHLKAGAHSFVFTAIGKNPSASDYNVGLDDINLSPVHGTGPTAALTASTGTATLPVLAGTPVTVDAGSSYAGASGLAANAYAFDFGDGTTAAAGPSATASHAYSAAGVYTASVTVTDGAGVSSTTSRQIYVTAPPSGLASTDGTSNASCSTTASSAPTMASLTPVLSATVIPGSSAQFELRDVTDPSVAPPLTITGAGSLGSAGPTSTLTTPTLVNGHEYGFAARSADPHGNVSPTSGTCYFWALTSGSQATPTGAAGIPLDNTMYPASASQTWTGPVSSLTWSNGNLAVHRNSDNALLWASGTSGPTNVLVPQYDGNIVIYSSQPTVSNTGWVSGTPVWNTDTSGQNATALLLATDGTLSVRSGTAAVWNAPFASHLWALNDGQGRTAADSGFVGGSPGTLDTVGVSWPSTSYATFAGSSRIATAGPVVDTTKSFTVSAWVNLAAKAAGVGQTMVVQQGTNVSGFYLEYNGSTWQFAMPSADTTSPATTRITSTSPAAVGVWTHLIGTYDSSKGKMTFYVNGVSNSSATIANSIPSTGILAMGRGFWNGAVDNRFTGSLADVRVFPQAVSDSQATSIYQGSTFTKPAVPGPAGALISANSTTGSQVCVDDLNGSLANSTTVIDVYGCNGTWPQAWQFGADGTIRLMGSNPATPPNKCLDTGGVNTQGSKVTLYDCQNGNQNQQWQVVPSASTAGKVSLLNPLSGMCLDNTNGSTSNTNPFQLYGCLDNANQHFTLPTAPGENQRAEAESLWGSSSGGSTQIQVGSEYSDGAQQFLGATTAGSSITLNMYVANAGRYAVTPLMTKAVDYGIVTASVDGTALPLTFNGYGGGITTQQFDFGGTVNLTAGMHSFTFTANTTDPASTGNRYDVGVDQLILQPTAR